MGYILPILPLQSMQYANIQRISSEHYSNVAALQRMGAQTNFEKQLSRKLERYNELEKSKKDRRKSHSKMVHADAGQIMQPHSVSNPNVAQNNAQLMKEIAQVTGKGRKANYTI